ncbi:MAG: hypothetical protein WBO45_18290 [Planctomycetota bacterium]
MRFQLGTLACLLAGCVAQPTSSTPSALATLGHADAAVRGGGRAAPTPPASFALRIAVEHLPPGTHATDQPPRCERLASGASPAPAAARVAERSTSWRLPRSNLLALATTDDPLAHATLRFLDDMVDTDRHRVAREVGLPFFDYQAVDPDRGPLLGSEVDLQTDHQLWVQEHGQVLLQRPLRRLARRLPLVRDLEVEFEDFRTDNESWTAENPKPPAGLGRIALRVHVNDTGDPLELGWKYGGLRLASSQEAGRAGFAMPLGEALHLELRTRTDYADHDVGLRLDLAWRHSARTSLHVAIGDDMDFLTTSSLYSLFESPMDGAPGLVVYAVHVF